MELGVIWVFELNNSMKTLMTKLLYMKLKWTFKIYLATQYLSTCDIQRFIDIVSTNDVFLGKCIYSNMDSGNYPNIPFGSCAMKRSPVLLQ